MAPINSDDKYVKIDNFTRATDNPDIVFISLIFPDKRLFSIDKRLWKK